ncbi:unnamed protein product [Cyclocybe aegerita]|uniref:Uncharacterized protein n=1 Tax=Cyclocybe aegerita TaxID=1973307 RepID=A0A8S0WVC9_CYCAE|nr:unnamed protein product [Cyclocybe aegerita]
MELFMRGPDEESFVYLANFTLLGSSARSGSEGCGTSFDPPTIAKMNDRRRHQSTSLNLPLQVLYLCFADTLREPFTVYSANTLYFNTIVWYEHLIWVPGVFMPYLFLALVALSAQTFFTYRIWNYGCHHFVAVEDDSYNYMRSSGSNPSSPSCPSYFNITYVFRPWYLIRSTPITSQHRSRRFIDLSAAKASQRSTNFVYLPSSSSAPLSTSRYQAAFGPVLKSTSSLLQRMRLLSVDTGMWTAFISCGTAIMFFRSGSEQTMWVGQGLTK